MNAGTVQHWSSSDWERALSNALALQAGPGEPTPVVEDPLLAIREVLETDIDPISRLSHFIATIRLVGEAIPALASPGVAERLDTLLAHLESTLTDIERRRPERGVLESPLQRLFDREDTPPELRIRALRALAALDLPESHAFWIRVARHGEDFLLAAEVLALRRKPEAGEAMAKAWRKLGSNDQATRTIQRLVRFLNREGIPLAWISDWVTRAFSDEHIPSEVTDRCLGTPQAERLPARATHSGTFPHTPRGGFGFP